MTVGFPRYLSALWHNGRSWLAMFSWLVLLLVSGGCSQPKVSEIATPTPTHCLVGIWEMENSETFLRYSIPPGAFDLTTLDFVDSTGGIAYRFDNQGVLTVEAVEFLGRFDVKIPPEILTLEIMMDGFASGNYLVKEDVVRVEGVINSKINYYALLAGESMMDDAKVDQFAPLFMTPYNAARFDCTSDKLRLTILNFPGVQEQIVFKRLN